MNEAPTELPKSVALLEQAHLLLSGTALLLESILEPPIDLDPVARSLEQAMACVYAAIDLKEDPLRLLESTEQHIASALPVLEIPKGSPQLAVAAEQLRSTLSALANARDPVARLMWVPPATPPELRASQDEPRLHAFAHAPLVPRVLTQPPPAAEVSATPPAVSQPRSFEELAAVVSELKQRAGTKAERDSATERSGSPPAPAVAPEVPEGFDPDPWPALTEPELIHARARDSFEEVAMLGMHRTPLLGDPWRGILAFERRMLANIDAFASLGPEALLALEGLTTHAPLKDPTRLFAIAMITGCIDGRDTLAAAERFFVQQELADPAYGRAFAGALALVPHPWVAPLCRRLLADPSADRRVLGLRVLLRKGLTTVEELRAAAFDEPIVASAALPAFALSGHSDVREAIGRASTLSDEQPSNAALFRATATALAFSADPREKAFIRSRIGGPLDRPALLELALVAGSEEAAELVELARTTPRAAVATAASWAGSPDAIPALIALLRSRDEETRVAAAYGLERLTAAGLLEEVAVPPEATEDVDLPEPDTGGEPPRAAPFAHALHQPSEGSPDLLERPSTDPRCWTAYYQQNAGRFPPGRRCRRGRPYTPLISLEELEYTPYLPSERRALQRELVIRTGAYVPFDPEDLVVVQARALEAWGDFARQASHDPGGWGTRAQRRA